MVFRPDLDFEFSRSNMEFAISQSKWPDCHEKKSKRIDWTLGLKCDHRVWPWPWPWPWIFEVRYGICYISAKNGAIATKRKANISIELQASNVTNGFDLGHDLTFEFSRSNVISTISWPGSGVRIYQIVTGVTSDVGVSSTHLVDSGNGLVPNRRQPISWTNGAQFTGAYMRHQGDELMIKLT